MSRRDPPREPRGGGCGPILVLLSAGLAVFVVYKGTNSVVLALTAGCAVFICLICLIAWRNS